MPFVVSYCPVAYYGPIKAGHVSGQLQPRRDKTKQDNRKRKEKIIRHRKTPNSLYSSCS